MKLTTMISMSVLAALGALVPAQQDGSMSMTMPAMHMTAKTDPAMVTAIIADWIPEAKMGAEKMIEKYGQPNEASATHLTWWHNGMWKWSKIENVAIPHDFPGPHHDMLQQAIDWKVDPSMFAKLAKYDGSVIVERTRGEVSARCDREEANILAINLAHDIVMKKKTVKEARAFYAETIMQFKAMHLDMRHKPYVSGFVFELPMSKQNDPDKPHMKGG